MTFLSISMTLQYHKMINKNIIQDKTYNLSLEIIDIYKYIVRTKKEYILSKQFIRSGTAIGANVEEALGAQSRKDFTAKMFIAYKEARETRYWTRLFRDSKLLDSKVVDPLLVQINEICKILGKILSSSRKG